MEAHYAGDALMTVFPGRLPYDTLDSGEAVHLADRLWGQVMGPDRWDAYYHAVRGTYVFPPDGGRGRTTIEFRAMPVEWVRTNAIMHAQTGLWYAPLPVDGD